MANVQAVHVQSLGKNGRYYDVMIQRTYAKGIINKEMISETIQCKMTEERLEKEQKKVNRGRMDHFTKFEPGKKYD